MDIACDLIFDKFDVFLERLDDFGFTKLVDVILTLFFQLLVLYCLAFVDFLYEINHLQSLPSDSANKHISDFGQEDLGVHLFALEGDVEIIAPRPNSLGKLLHRDFLLDVYHILVEAKDIFLHSIFFGQGHELLLEVLMLHHVLVVTIIKSTLSFN